MAEETRILVVDDDKDLLASLVAVLEGNGYVVDTAKSGKEAIEKSKAEYYDLALLDIRLPDMEGTELLTEMKDTFPKMVKIMITGFPSLQNAVEALNKGADAYIIKPVIIDNLLKTVEMQLRKQRQAREFAEDKVAEFIDRRVKELERGV